MLQIVVFHVYLWFCAIFCILLSGKLFFVEIRVSLNLQAEQETDEVYAQITLHPEADVRNMFFFFVLFIVLCQLALFDY